MILELLELVLCIGGIGLYWYIVIRVTDRLSRKD